MGAPAIVVAGDDEAEATPVGVAEGLFAHQDSLLIDGDRRGLSALA
ncbi:MAG: hypothetical protein R3272_10955 [Candidatus Promineifilaceae bacterium]|nr:hypothetical protein [Candidatus Promineifilaceae bacterium]